MMIAEDSTDFPYVTKSVADGGVGFDYKWDMGWMNDTLRYFKEDPVYRQYDHNLLTFSMMYFYTENFILPFSHDEVVHSKGTILDKMWGNNDQKFAQVKSLYTYMFTHPGKKLNFMGNELAEYKEWDERKALGWSILKYPQHDSFNKFFRDLNKLYTTHDAFYDDYNPDSFRWLVVDDNSQSVFAYARMNPDGGCLVFVGNFIGNQHEEYTVPVPFAGSYKEVLNTDAAEYTGSNYVNSRAIRSKKGKVLNEENYIKVKLAPFASCVFEYHGEETLNSVRKAKAEAEEKARKEAEAKAKKEAEDQAKAEAEAKKAEEKKTTVKKEVQAKTKSDTVKKSTKAAPAKKTATKKAAEKVPKKASKTKKKTTN